MRTCISTFAVRGRDSAGAQFVIGGAPPTARNPMSNDEIRDIQSWLRLGYEIQVAVEEENLANSSGGGNHTESGPKVRKSSVKPYSPSY